MQKIRKPLVVIGGGIAAVVLIGVAVMFFSLRSVADGSRHVDFPVKSGSNLSTVSARLAEAKLIHS